MERIERSSRKFTGGIKMKRIKNFVKNTFKDLPKEEREKVVGTVIITLTEKVEDLVEQGLTIDEAIDKTVIEFGTIEDYIEPSEKKTRFKSLKTLGNYRNDLYLSIFGSMIIVGIMIYINLAFSDELLWFVVPAIAILWWPLIIFYRLLNKIESAKGEKNE